MVTQQQAIQMANAFKEDACLFMDMNPSSIHLELIPLSNIPKGISPFATVEPAYNKIYLLIIAIFFTLLHTSSTLN